ncbi:hypothetical protein F5Y03DRAFT_400441 [Xylaria venustula]|nr:hypothetical protein F5Y03DRAFT_400441 [Xylaria venustula]
MSNLATTTMLLTTVTEAVALSNQLQMFVQDLRRSLFDLLSSSIGWEDVPRSVFQHFAEFTYKGNHYSGEKPIKSNAVPPEPPEPPKEYSSDAFALL